MPLNLTRTQFRQLSSLIYSELGIKMPESKMTMLTGRINKRLRALKLNDFSQYCELLFSSPGRKEEIVHLYDAVTTNKTDFFREPTHFEYLSSVALPEIHRLGDAAGRRKIRVWSAGCSTGEEPYSLAMVLAEYAERHSGFRFEILATDISTRVLEIARRGVYRMERISPMDMKLRKKYLLRRRDLNNPEVRIAPELRQMVTFGRLNFMAEDFGLTEKVDIIFCRNVIIYFDRQTQEKLMQKFGRYIHSGGYLFLGHSESLHGYSTPFHQVASTIYRYQ